VEETEIKLRLAGPEAARAAVERLGAMRGRERHFEDNVLYDDAAASLRAGGSLLRLRRTHGVATLTYKGPRRIVEGVKVREERETRVEDPDALDAILRATGLRPTFRYQKYRETFAWRDLEIVIDETPIGTFLEIEGDLAGIHTAAAALGFGAQDYVSDSYAALFFASGGTGDMVFPR
jgi:adenylate cyclase class 2